MDHSTSTTPSGSWEWGNECIIHKTGWLSACTPSVFSIKLHTFTTNPFCSFVDKRLWRTFLSRFFPSESCSLAFSPEDLCENKSFSHRLYPQIRAQKTYSFACITFKKPKFWWICTIALMYLFEWCISQCVCAKQTYRVEIHLKCRCMVQEGSPQLLPQHLMFWRLRLDGPQDMYWVSVPRLP